MMEHELGPSKPGQAGTLTDEMISAGVLKLRSFLSEDERRVYADEDIVAAIWAAMRCPSDTRR